MNFLYINFPSFIHPELFPKVPVLNLIHWYGLMYIFAFTTAWFILKKLCREGFLDSRGPNNELLQKTTEDDVFSFLATGIIFLILGARIFSTLVYDTSGDYFKKPWLIFWPFDSNMHFTGLRGMSYHGGFIGGLFGMLFWCKRHKRPVLLWLDAIALAIPLGYTFGRLGNFFNGELYGRITTVPWGMVFPSADKFSSSIDWVKEFAARVNMNIDGITKVNLPRHPSQIYEAVFEGVILWLALWNIRKFKKFDGFIAPFYPIGYGLARFVIEYFREPDADLGFRIGPNTNAHIYENTSLLNLSTGQILCALMIIGGIAMFIGCYLWNKRQKSVLEN